MQKHWTSWHHDLIQAGSQFRHCCFKFVQQRRGRNKVPQIRKGAIPLYIYNLCYTIPKTNSSHLKITGWEAIHILSCWVSAHSHVQWLLLLVLRKVILPSAGVLRIRPSQFFISPREGPPVPLVELAPFPCAASDGCWREEYDMKPVAVYVDSRQ